MCIDCPKSVSEATMVLYARIIRLGLDATTPHLAVRIFYRNL
jgi:hypothetical protein